MAYFAEIDEKGNVLRVLVTDSQLPNEGLDWLESRLGGTWIKTDKKTKKGIHIEGGQPFRKNFASKGMIYDETRDAFIPKKPYDSFVLNEETCIWEAPVPYPNDGKSYEWDEEKLAWVEIKLDND